MEGRQYPRQITCRRCGRTFTVDSATEVTTVDGEFSTYPSVNCPHCQKGSLIMDIMDDEICPVSYSFGGRHI